jgi:hypothetical protein
VLQLGIFVYFCNSVAFIGMTSSKYSSGADRLGITSAVICTVHCLVVPSVFLLKYWWTNTSGREFWSSGLPAWWETLDYLFLIIGFIAVYHAASHASGRGVKLSLWLFWLCLAVAIVFEDKLHWMAYIASAGLIVTHFINIREHQKRRVRK